MEIVDYQAGGCQNLILPPLEHASMQDDPLGFPDSSAYHLSFDAQAPSWLPNFLDPNFHLVEEKALWSVSAEKTKRIYEEMLHSKN